LAGFGRVGNGCHAQPVSQPGCHTHPGAVDVAMTEPEPPELYLLTPDAGARGARGSASIEGDGRRRSLTGVPTTKTARAPERVPAPDFPKRTPSPISSREGV